MSNNVQKTYYLNTGIVEDVSALAKQEGVVDSAIVNKALRAYILENLRKSELVELEEFTFQREDSLVDVPLNHEVFEPNPEKLTLIED